MSTQRLATATTQATSSVTSRGDTSHQAPHEANIQTVSYYFPHSTVTDSRRRRAALDNLCLKNINSPSSKCNAKLQLAVHKRGVAILITGESRAARSIVVQPRTVDCHGAGLQVVPLTHSRPS